MRKLYPFHMEYYESTSTFKNEQMFLVLLCKMQRSNWIWNLHVCFELFKMWRESYFIQSFGSKCSIQVNLHTCDYPYTYLYVWPLLQLDTSCRVLISRTLTLNTKAIYPIFFQMPNMCSYFGGKTNQRGSWQIDFRIKNIGPFKSYEFGRFLTKICYSVARNQSVVSWDSI